MGKENLKKNWEMNVKFQQLSQRWICYGAGMFFGRGRFDSSLKNHEKKTISFDFAKTCQIIKFIHNGKKSPFKTTIQNTYELSNFPLSEKEISLEIITWLLQSFDLSLIKSVWTELNKRIRNEFTWRILEEWEWAFFSDWRMFWKVWHLREKNCWKDVGSF